MKGNEFSYDKIGLPVLPKQTVDYSMIPVLNRYAPTFSSSSKFEFCKIWAFLSSKDAFLTFKAIKLNI